MLVLKYGPIAFDLIEELASVWNKEMAPEELLAFCKSKRQSVTQYIMDERKSREAVKEVQG